MESFKDFIEIEDYINDTLKIISEIEGKCSNLHEIYKQYLKQIIETKDYLTSLDTLYFQITLTEKELENFVQIFDIFIYQMYGQYYKFYIDLLLEKYSIEDIKSIHNFILSVIICINNYIEKQKYDIEDDYIRVKKGVNIDSLVFEKKKFVDFLYNENELFIKTKTKFYDYQKKIIKRLILKLKLLYLQIDQDIQFESFNYKTNLYDNVQCYFKTGIIKFLHLFCLR